jgi:hypothetical protein
LAGTRAQSGDRYGSGTLHPGQVLRGSLTLLSPAFRRSHLYLNDARDPISERWNYGREMSCNFADMTSQFIFYMPQIYDIGPTALFPLQRKAY